LFLKKCNKKYKLGGNWMNIAGIPRFLGDAASSPEIAREATKQAAQSFGQQPQLPPDQPAQDQYGSNPPSAQPTPEKKGFFKNLFNKKDNAEQAPQAPAAAPISSMPEGVTPPQPAQLAAAEATQAPAADAPAQDPAASAPAPQSPAPAPEAPKADAPAPGADAPKTDASPQDPAAAPAPGADAPKTDAPAQDPAAAPIPGAEAPKADAPAQGADSSAKK